ncbi:hypothetical protein [Polaromonas sp.]|uniref:hypothetical protein n=1 Tax=Polaromonas sp. TaxID=1869339 RepID=UPI00326533F2
MSKTLMPARPIADQEEVQANRQARSNREAILQTITDLSDHNKMASRSRIAELTGLKMSIVDDHVDRLKNDGMIRALYNGVFEPVDQTPDRNVSSTSLSRGRLKIEIGDDICTNLTPREQLALAKQLAGVLMAFGMMR